MGDDEEFDELPARRMGWRDFVVIPLAVMTDIAEAVTTGLELLLKAVVMDDNYRIDQAAFAEQVRTDIESIPQE